MRHTIIFAVGFFLVLLGCQEPASQRQDAAAPTDTTQEAPPTAPVPASEPDWQVRTMTSPVDGTDVIILQRTAREVRARSTADPPILYIRCREGTTDLYIDWHDYIAGSTHRVTIRLDRGPTRARMWALSRSNVATFYPESPVALLQEMINAEILFAEAEPYNTAAVTTVFALDGLAAAIQPLRTACGW
jgi:type VI secretion system protein VasI